MKQKFIIGMLLSVALVAPHFATAAPSSKAALAKYLENEGKAHANKVIAGGKGVEAQLKSAGLSTALREMKLPESDANRIKAVIEAGGENSSAILTSATKLSMARKFAEQNKDSEILATSEAYLQALTNVDRIGVKEKSETMSAEEYADAKVATTKLVTTMGERAVTMETAETASYTAVAKEFNSILKKDPRMDGTEALLQAIMTTQKVDRTKAMEILRKLKDCV
jgi:hypothetical protein